MTATKARVHLIFGTMTFGEEGKNGVRTALLPECQKILDLFFDMGYNEIDTARVYAEGTTEHHLGKLNLKGAALDTKVWPVNDGDHAPDKLEATFRTSLAALKVSSVRVLYLHKPDRSVPFEDTCRKMNELHREGLFQIFGLSNFAAWEVAEVVGICKANGWVLPGIYQAMYNGIARPIEKELVPCLRKYGIRLVVYNPLAGGFFAGKIASAGAEAPSGGRFDTSQPMGKMYSERYLRQGFFEALKVLQQASEKYNVRLTEIALRWCQHHSVLTPEDGVILGASSAEQLAQNCEDSAKGPLEEGVLQAMEEAHQIVLASGDTPSYFR